MVNILIDGNAGLGDLIIQKNFIKNVFEDGEDIHIDFCLIFEGLLDFAQKLFCDLPYVEPRYDDYNLFVRMKRRYPIQIRIAHGIIFDNQDISQIKNETIRNNIIYLLNKYDQYEAFNIDDRFHMATTILRSKFWSNNCYTMYNFDNEKKIIKDWHTHIPLFKSYELPLLKTNFYNSKYITITTDWGANMTTDDSTTHAKAWRLDRWEELVDMLKNQYPDIKIIQTECNDNRKLKNADDYLFGSSLETVKFLLKNSVLHIGSEGGIVHLASQIGTKCAVLFGQSPLHYYGYKNNINIQVGKCQGCVQCCKDVTACLRKMDNPECMELITADIVLKKIEKYLDKTLNERT